MNHGFRVVVVVAAFLMGLAFTGCGASGASDLAALDGEWENPDHGKVVFQLSGKNPSIGLQGATLPVSIKKAEGDVLILHVSNKERGDQDWKLTKVWDDNGVNFTLKFQHGDVAEPLTRLGG